MKRIIFSLFVTVIFVNGIQAQNWLTDFNEAKVISEKKDIPILLVFSGSDWCAPCIKLDRNIWQSRTFIEYSKDHYVLLRADFPRNKGNQLSKEQLKKNEALAEKYNTRGFFPLVVLLNSSGQVLGTTGYKNVSPSEYIKILESLKE
ncbi:thioredoxin family protein [Marinilabilia salmonicolor]|jgi:thioredoxin-related protein|uniref:Thioredoxin-like protein n=1 Tax=Marinilabilia salmonicolor TaxID=989 RepID=A0A368V6U7_9BACT|nr:thioredoxin family protein [Marinilabilia salmonicolor]RCW36050.1 thioredoxin-like protein [Marinilabilia salmonicolor]